MKTGSQYADFLIPRFLLLFLKASVCKLLLAPELWEYATSYIVNRGRIILSMTACNAHVVITMLKPTKCYQYKNIKQACICQHK